MNNFENLLKRGGYVSFLPLFKELDARLSEGEDLIVAIDGGSASGKTTLASLICEAFDAVVFHMDDFFLPFEMRTSERLSEAGGNVHRERFLSEVLLPLSRKEAVMYRKFDCSCGTLSEPISATPKRLTVIEGAYSLHPELCSYYDFTVLLEVDKKMQAQRILERDASKAERFFNEWIVYEDTYFEKTGIRSRCDLIINTK